LDLPDAKAMIRDGSPAELPKLADLKAEVYDCREDMQTSAGGRRKNFSFRKNVICTIRMIRKQPSGKCK
jgi:hypothetical protein